ncbi:hypothetical protein V6N11_029331 [Hibiscus sabdariffa]|uniref:Uncharacterized protein n=1 Tax=Hibiscus sabdariffa TaxID=183260 RepID=A0ABR1ZJE8_9ROSI
MYTRFQSNISCNHLTLETLHWLLNSNIILPSPNFHASEVTPNFGFRDGTRAYTWIHSVHLPTHCAPLDRNVIMSSEHLSRKTGSVASDNAKDLPIPRKKWSVNEGLPTGETVFICIYILHYFISC